LYWSRSSQIGEVCVTWENHILGYSADVGRWPAEIFLMVVLENADPGCCPMVVVAELYMVD